MNFVAGAYFLYQEDSRDIEWYWQHDPGTFAGVAQSLFFCQPDQGGDPYTVNPACLASRPELCSRGRPLVSEFRRRELLSVSSGQFRDHARAGILTVGGCYTTDKKTVEGYVNGDLSFAVNQYRVPVFHGHCGRLQCGP